MDKKIKKTKLAIFDFDGTLVDTELPDTGKVIWEKSTGKAWPHQGWWSKPESLDIDIFDNNLIPSVKHEYDVVKTEPNTVSIMMTGRRSQLKHEVDKILDKHGLEFDEKHFNTGRKTEVCKMRTIDNLLKKYKDVEDVLLIDDREEHISIFHDFLQKKIEEGLIKRYTIIQVFSERHKTH